MRPGTQSFARAAEVETLGLVPTEGAGATGNERQLLQRNQAWSVKVYARGPCEWSRQRHDWRQHAAAEANGTSMCHAQSREDPSVSSSMHGRQLSSTDTRVHLAGSSRCIQAFAPASHAHRFPHAFSPARHAWCDGHAGHGRRQRSQLRNVQVCRCDRTPRIACCSISNLDHRVKRSWRLRLRNNW